jgi:hypothetical protein
MFRTRLLMEVLDARNAPSNLVGNDVANTDWMTPADSDAPPPVYGDEYQGANVAPKITNFKVTVGANNVATFSGTVVDEAAAGLTVTLTGPQGCLQPGGVAVVTDANGNFSWQGTVAPTVDTGTVKATVTDPHGLTGSATYYLIV